MASGSVYMVKSWNLQDPIDVQARLLQPHNLQTSICIRSGLHNSFLGPISTPTMSNSNQPVDLSHALSLFTDHWSPKRIATLNDYDIKVIKVSNSFVWHSHKDTDELFIVLSGTLIIQFHPEDGGDVVLSPNQLFVVPKGVQHCPRTEDSEEVSILLIEPKGVVNTGEVTGSKLTNEVKDLN